MIAVGRELERVTRVTPFGFLLWDEAAGVAVADGLRVVARPAIGTARPVTAGPAGVFAIRDLSIGWAFTRGAGDAAFWAAPPALGAAWTIEVDDPVGRYLPFRFTADGAMRVGNAYRELCRIPATEVADPPPAAGPASDAALPRLPLFPAPTRSAPPGMATVRLDLATTSRAGAGGALVTVRVGGVDVARGMADGAGRVVAFLPYPAPERAAGPGGVVRRPLTDERWTNVRVRASWSSGLDRRDRPDLCAVLAQPEVPILAKTQPKTELADLTLEYGRPLVVRTADRPVALLDTGAPPGP